MTNNGLKAVVEKTTSWRRANNNLFALKVDIYRFDSENDDSVIKSTRIGNNVN